MKPPFLTRRKQLIISLALSLLALEVFLMSSGFLQFFERLSYRSLASVSALTLKGGSSIGYKLAFAGSMMIIASQLYSARLRLPPSASPFIGRTGSWLTAHCIIDIAAASMVLVHSGFPLSFTYANPFVFIHPSLGIRGLVGLQGLAAWMVLFSAISGFFGRYLYKRVGSGLKKPFRYWRFTHLIWSSLLYVSGSIHIILVLWLEQRSAI